MGTGQSSLTSFEAEAKVPGDKERFLLQTRSLLAHTYKSGFIPGIFKQTLERLDPEGTGEYSELAYAMSEAAYREMSEKIDLEWEIEFLDLAYDMAVEAHQGVVRDSGEPYVSHPIAVAKITLEEFPNPTTFKAIVALLHDVIEDAPDPVAKKAELLRRFKQKAEEKRTKFIAEIGPDGAQKKVAFMISFAESIVEAVEMLSKKRKEDYLWAWEKPLLAFENAMENAVDAASMPFLWWSPLAKPPKVWNRLMKDRADGEYFARFEFALSNRLFIAVLYDKLADRLHNLRTPKPDKADKSKPDPAALVKMLDETEAHYFSLAERLDPQIYLLIEHEVNHWRGYLSTLAVEDSTKKRTKRALKDARR